MKSNNLKKMCFVFLGLFFLQNDYGMITAGCLCLQNFGLIGKKKSPSPKKSPSLTPSLSSSKNDSLRILSGENKPIGADPMDKTEGSLKCNKEHYTDDFWFYYNANDNEVLSADGYALKIIKQEKEKKQREEEKVKHRQEVQNKINVYHAKQNELRELESKCEEMEEMEKNKKLPDGVWIIFFPSVIFRGDPKNQESLDAAAELQKKYNKLKEQIDKLSSVILYGYKCTPLQESYNDALAAIKKYCEEYKLDKSDEGFLFQELKKNLIKAQEDNLYKK